MKRVLWGSLIIVTVMSTVSFSYAQTNTDLTLTMTPEYPKPKDPISLHLESFTTDLNRATISWYVNGSLRSQGVGLTTYETTAGAEGSRTTIRALAQTTNGRRYEKSITINPGYVDLLWEAKSYTPPFYKGKALFPAQGEVTIVAMPYLVESGVRLGAKSLVYTWRVNDELQQSGSGFGKDSLKVVGGVISRPIEVRVTVASKTGRTTGEGRVVISPQTPQVIFYEESPLYGPLYHHALESAVTLKREELWLKAAPYYFSTIVPQDTSSVDFVWSLNNQKITAQREDTLILRHDGSSSGRSNISLRTTSPTHILQLTDSHISVFFNKQQ
jgi:hypothetical protein